ncbi:MAG: hypothetical protein NTY68_02745 [Candidatus Micrarchaeota archaeon]|nr:hypothetical protein [Candidatus Micrarchaeota archaeon]
MASPKSRIRSAVINTLIATQLGIASPMGMPDRYKHVGENMATEKMAIKEENEQKKLADKLFDEFSRKKGGWIHPTEPMFPKLENKEPDEKGAVAKEKYYLEFIKAYHINPTGNYSQDKSLFLKRLSEAVKKYKGTDVDETFLNLKYGLADLTAAENNRQDNLTRDERRKEGLQRAKEAISKSGIFAVKGSEAGKAIEVPEAPKATVDTGKGKMVAKPKEEKIEERKAAAEVDFSAAFPEKAAPAGKAEVPAPAKKAEKAQDEEARIKKGAEKLYDRFSSQYPKITKDKYEDYLRAFGKKYSIYDTNTFIVSIGNEKNIGNGMMQAMTYAELAMQAQNAGKMKEAEELRAISKRFEATAKALESKAAAKATAPATTVPAVPKAAAQKPAEIKKETVAAKVAAPVTTAPAVLKEKEAMPAIMAGKSIFEQTQSIFQTEQNIQKDKKTGTAEPENMAALQSFLQVSKFNYAELTGATGKDFIKELQENEKNGGTVEERGARNYEIVATMIGAVAIFNAFKDNGMDVKKGQLKDYCGNDGYAENLGRVLSYSPLNNQAKFITEVNSFIKGAITKDGKLTEINGEGKDEKGRSNEGMFVFSISAIDEIYYQLRIADVFDLKEASALERKKTADDKVKDINNRITAIKDSANVAVSKKSKKKVAPKQKAEKAAAAPDEVALRQELEKANAEKRTEERNLEQIRRYAPDRKLTIEKVYRRYKEEYRDRMPLLYEFVASRKGMDGYIRDGIRDKLMGENVTAAVLLQQAIEAANPAGRVELEELSKVGNVLKNYNVLLMQYLKEMTLRKVPSSEKLEYWRLIDNVYERNGVISRITANMGLEEASTFMIDLADPANAKKGEAYGEYIKRKLKDKWKEPVVIKEKDDKTGKETVTTLPSCLEQYRADFEKTYEKKLDCKDDVLLSLIIDHRITEAEMDFFISNGGNLDVLNDKIRRAKLDITVDKIKSNSFGNETEDIKAIGEAMNNAADIIGFNYNIVEKVLKTVGLSGILKNPENQFIEEFRDDILAWLAVRDVENKTGKLTLDGISITDKRGVKIYGKGAFNANITELQNDVKRISPSVSVSGDIKSKSMIFQEDPTQKATAYLNLFFRKYFPAEDKRYTDITMDKLSDTKSRLDDWENIIKNMKPTEQYYIARHKEGRDGCIRVIEFMKHKIDNMMEDMAKETARPGETKVKNINSNSVTPDERFLLKMAMFGKPMLAGLNGFPVSEEIAGPKDQAFIPAMFYLMDNVDQISKLLGMTEGEPISTSIKTDLDAKTVASSLEAEM